MDRACRADRGDVRTAVSRACWVICILWFSNRSGGANDVLGVFYPAVLRVVEFQMEEDFLIPWCVAFWVNPDLDGGEVFIFSGFDHGENRFLWIVFRCS